MLEKYPLIATQSPRVAEAKLMTISRAKSFAVTGDRSDFSMISNFVPLKNVHLLYLWCSVAGQMEANEASYIRHHFPIAGTARLTVDGSSVDISPRSPGFIVPADKTLLFEAGSKYAHLVVRVEMEALQRKLGVILDSGSIDNLKFEHATSLKRGSMQGLRQVIFQLASDIDLFGDHLSAMAMEELEQSILLRYLLFYQHNYSAALGSPPPLASRFQVRAAESYIEANWDKPLDIEKLAQAVGTSVRSVFRHFKKARGCSPFEFAKMIRLQQARAMLRAGDEKSVIGIALKCGFHSVGHFAQEYRGAFGELPSQTMRQSTR